MHIRNLISELNGFLQMQHTMQPNEKNEKKLGEQVKRAKHSSSIDLTKIQLKFGIFYFSSFRLFILLMIALMLTHTSISLCVCCFLVLNVKKINTFTNKFYASLIIFTVSINDFRYNLARCTTVSVYREYWIGP